MSEIDWPSWSPGDRATLLFVIRDGEVLLIRKKRGLGAGKINGPGGRIEAGESPLEAAIREVQEEVGVTPTDYGLIPVKGELVVASAREFAVRRHDEQAGEVVVHFPRVGFTIAK